MKRSDVEGIVREEVGRGRGLLSRAVAVEPYAVVIEEARGNIRLTKADFEALVQQITARLIDRLTRQR